MPKVTMLVHAPGISEKPKYVSYNSDQFAVAKISLEEKGSAEAKEAASFQIEEHEIEPSALENFDRPIQAVVFRIGAKDFADLTPMAKIIDAIESTYKPLAKRVSPQGLVARPLFYFEVVAEEKAGEKELAKAMYPMRKQLLQQVESTGEFFAICLPSEIKKEHQLRKRADAITSYFQFVQNQKELPKRLDVTLALEFDKLLKDYRAEKESWALWMLYRKAKKISFIELLLYHFENANTGFIQLENGADLLLTAMKQVTTQNLDYQKESVTGGWILSHRLDDLIKQLTEVTQKKNEELPGTIVESVATTSPSQ